MDPKKLLFLFFQKNSLKRKFGLKHEWYHFWFTFQCSHFLYNFQKKVLDPNGPYIGTSQTKIRNVCLSSLVFVVCSASTAYTSLCRL